MPAKEAYIKEQRDKIYGVDVELVALVNKRFKLVQELKRFKESHGIEFEDPEREDFLRTMMVRANKGPMSDQAIIAIYQTVLDLVKMEAM